MISLKISLSPLQQHTYFYVSLTDGAAKIFYRNLSCTESLKTNSRANRHWEIAAGKEEGKSPENNHFPMTRFEPMDCLRNRGYYPLGHYALPF